MNTEKEPEMNPSAEEQNTEAEKTAETAAAAEKASEAAEAAGTAEQPAEPDQQPDAAEKPAEEQPAEEEPKPEKAKKKKSAALFQSERFKHGSIATAFTAGFIAIVVLLNVIVGILGDRYPSVNLDITKSSNNTLSAEALEIVDKVTTPVEITICASKAACESGSVTSSGGDYSEVNSLLSKAAERNGNITLNYVDLDKDPTFAQQYKSDSLTTGDVIVKSSKRYRVLTPSDLFTSSTDSQTYTTTYYSNVDASFASALNNVISEAVPVVAFETGHSEQMDTAGYKKLLGNASFEAKEFNILTEEIPANTQIVVLGCPTTDFTDAEIKKLETYLHDTSTTVNRSLLVTYSPGQGGLTTLDAYLSEWGLSAATDSVIAETNSSKYYSNQLMIFSDVDSDDITLKSSGTTYSNLLTPYASPVTIQGKSVGMKSLYAL
jgi:ABC-2 type transport system permease protein